MKRVLVFAPHADDELIGCAGTLLSLAAQRETDTVVAYVTTPESRRRVEAEQVCGGFGWQPLFLNLWTERLPVPGDALHEMLALVRRHRPHAVFLPHEAEGDSDHRRTSRLVQEACRFSGTGFAAQAGAPWLPAWVLGYEVWTPLADPELIVDVSSTFARKLEALSMYSSQTEQRDYASMVDGLARYRGVTAGCVHAEAFEVLHVSDDAFLKENA